MDDIDRNRANSLRNFYNSVYRTLNKNLTITGLVFACVNISLGVFLAVFDWYWQLIWYFVLGIIIAIYIILEANKYFGKLNANKLAEQNKSLNGNQLYGSARSSLSKDARSNASSNIYNRDDISMDYLESSSQPTTNIASLSNNGSSQQMQRQRQHSSSSANCNYSSNNISMSTGMTNSRGGVATIQNDYSLRRVGPPPTAVGAVHNVSFREDDSSYASNRQAYIQTGFVSGGGPPRRN